MKYIHYAFLCLGFLLFSCKKKKTEINILTQIPHVKQSITKQGTTTYKRNYYYNSEGNVIKDSLFKNGIYQGGVFYSYRGDSVLRNTTLLSIGSYPIGYLIDKNNRLATKAFYNNQPNTLTEDTLIYQNGFLITESHSYQVFSPFSVLYKTTNYTYQNENLKTVIESNSTSSDTKRWNYMHVSDTVSTIENINFGLSWLGKQNTTGIINECYSVSTNPLSISCSNYKYVYDDKKRIISKIILGSDTTFYTYY
jgi:hypothetical protein